MEVTWHKTACFTIEEGDTTLLVDPFLPLNSDKAEKERLFSLFLRASFVLITHNHFDHAMPVPDLVRANPALPVYGTKDVLRTLSLLGVPKENLHEIRAGESFSCGGFSIRPYPSVHMRYAFYRLPALGIRCLLHLSECRHILALNRPFDRVIRGAREILFFDIAGKDKRVQVMGSMGLKENVAYPKGADLLLLAYAGAFRPRQKALSYVKRLSPKKVLPHHFDDTYPPLTSEENLSPPQKNFGKELLLLSFPRGGGKNRAVNLRARCSLQRARIRSQRASYPYSDRRSSSNFFPMASYPSSGSEISLESDSMGHSPVPVRLTMQSTSFP